MLQNPTLRSLRLSTIISLFLFVVYLINSMYPFLSLGPEQYKVDNSILTWMLFSAVLLCFHWFLYLYGRKQKNAMYQFLLQNAFNITCLLYLSLQAPPIYWWYTTHDSFPMPIPILMIPVHGVLAIVSSSAIYRVIKNGL